MLRKSTFSFASWSSVTSEDNPAIKSLSAEPTCCENMSPTCWEGLIESRASIAVRREGELVGWVLTMLDTTGAEPTLSCESGYVRHDLWRTGVLVEAYYHAYSEAAKHFGPGTIVRFSTGPRMPGMMALTRRRFAPVSLWVDDWLVSRKSLLATGKAARGEMGSAAHFL